MKTKLLFLLLAVFQLSNAQERTCASESKLQEMLINPVFKQQHEVQIKKSEQELFRLQNTSNKNFSVQSTYTIPVAVHFITGSNANRTCLVALAQNQINILNNDYKALNADLSIWTNSTGFNFPGVNPGIIDVQFVLATQNHPQGFDANLVNGQPCVTIGYDYSEFSDFNTAWAGYLNIVVDNLGGGILGYAYPASSPASGAAVYISRTAFASGSGCIGHIPSSPYNLGRTLTHELGHYLNLKHIWGDANCGNDSVADTPVHNTSNGGCPSSSHTSTCSGNPLELTMNYMDYTNDACMYMFTAGQAQRSIAHLNTIYSSFNQGTLSNDIIDSKKDFAIYPNPNEGNFKIQLSDLQDSFSVQIYDNSGRVVYDREFNQINSLTQAIDLGNISSGIYLVSLKDSNNKTITKKIIVE
jgi:hypothetical protein